MTLTKLRLQAFRALSLIGCVLLCLSQAQGKAQAQAIANLLEIPDSDLTWENLPGELTIRAIPFIDLGDLRLKVGETSGKQQYLQIGVRRKAELSFGIKPVNSEEVGYVVLAGRGFYWPDRHLLRLEQGIIVSASSCRLEGSTLDIHLLHDTVRLAGENMVISLPGGLKPIETGSVRISGLGGPSSPHFDWDPVEVATVRAIPTPTPLPKVGNLEVRLLDGSKIEFENKTFSQDDFRARIRELAGVNPDSKFSVLLGPGASSGLSDRVVAILEESGFNVTEKRSYTPDLEQESLEPEVPKVLLETADPSAPTGPGATFLWVAGSGQYILNGQSFNEGAVRQALRDLARSSPDNPLVIAGPENAPPDLFRNLISDLRIFGFREIQVGVNVLEWER
jgi:biopolymer transport protein ExbD